jgi:hypothetical protein
MKTGRTTLRGRCSRVRVVARRRQERAAFRGLVMGATIAWWRPGNGWRRRAPARAAGSPGARIHARGGRSMVRPIPRGRTGTSMRMARISLAARATPTNDTGTARSGLGEGVAAGALGSAGSERVASGEALAQGSEASSTRPRTAVPIGGAATERPSSLHIGTAACARAPRSRAPSTMSAATSLEAPRRGPVRLKTEYASTFNRPKASGFYPRAGGSQPVG